ncbi:hypothetical protein HK105_205117 [Polyrhizophydium stewartii]|uniref:Aminopeptidase n=1 Tax=Polyrhizophydium stewartii TaxID=2732419 RepID=A0ABR4N6S8_9FUNG|nr:Aminopeptidase 2 mitochondrial [Polyrhizophydium stewartii]
MCKCLLSDSGSTAAVQRNVLPTTVKPSHYDLELTPNLETFEFQGTVAVSLDVKETVKTIVANANDLQVHSGKVVVVAGGAETTQIATSVVVSKEAQTVTFEFANEIPAGAKATLHATFTGTHNDQMVGFYRSSYMDKTGAEPVKKYMAVTQFESSDARRAFPCWDEPNLKATFDVKLVVRPGLCALSNMNEVEEQLVKSEAGEVLKEVRFARTPIMSTYLVAFAVGEFEFIEAMAHPKLPADAQPIKMRVYTHKGDIHRAQFALDVGVRTIEFFSEFYGVAYPLPKLDQIAVPDFAAGAMENWGLVTYREQLLLVDETTTTRRRQFVADVIGHEFAHQWFGNLVTMDWWSELWLNEGFATFMGTSATVHNFPEWNYWTQFVHDDYMQGLGLDSLRSSHPIEVDVRSAEEVDQIFDAISYSKGASVIRMLSSFLGAETFAKGVHQYLKKFAYQNAKTTDLWASLSEASGFDVADIMYAWTRKTGFPVLDVVSESFDASKGELTLTIRQSRFLSSGDLTPEEDAEALWTVPLTVVTHLNRHTPTRHVLREKMTTITIPYTEERGHFWKLNYRTTGFFRVNLTASQQAHLASALRADFDFFTVEDRIGIVYDSFSTAKAGLSSTSGALDIVTGYAAETDYTVLSSISQNLASVKRLCLAEPRSTIEGLDALIRLVFSDKARAMGFEYAEDEDPNVQLKRTLVLSEAAGANDEEIAAELVRRYERYIAGDDKALHANLRSLAFATANKRSQTDAVFEQLLSLAKTSDAAAVQLDALRAIGSSPSLDVVRRSLALVLDSETVRLQDVTVPLNSLVASPAFGEARVVMWEWLRANWEALHERMSAAMGLLGSVVTLSVTFHTSAELADEIEAWARGDDLATDEAKAKRVEQLKSARRPLDQSLERVRTNAKWLARDRAAIAAWVAARQ